MRCDNPAWYIRKREKLTEKFRKDRQKAQLRKSLLLTNPHCDNCGRRLQGHDHELDNYAHVILAIQKMSCRDYVVIVRALAAAEAAG